LCILRDCDADIGDLIVSSVNCSSPMTDFRFCLRFTNDSVLCSWMRIDRLAVTLPSILDFGCLTSELLGRGFFSSASDPEVFDVNESFEAELRSLAVYALRFPFILFASPALSFEEFERPTVVAVELVLFRPPNKGRTFFMGRSGE